MDEHEIRRIEHLVVVDLKQHFDALLSERDKRIDDAFKAAERAVSLAVESQEQRQQERDQATNHRLALLNEFRGQAEAHSRTYATREFVDQTFIELRAAISKLSEDRVHSFEFEAIKQQLDEGRGRRAAFQVSMGIIVTLISVSLGLMWKGQPDRNDFTQQIKTEAPWLDDRPTIERRLSSLEAEDQKILLRLSGIDALNRFFCRTRSPQLPAC